MSRSQSVPEIIITPYTSDIYQSGPGTPPHGKKRMSTSIIIGIVVIVLICSGAVGFFVYSPLKHRFSSIPKTIDYLSNSSDDNINKNLLTSNNMTDNTTSYTFSETSSETTSPIVVTEAPSVVETVLSTEAPITPAPITVTSSPISTVPPTTLPLDTTSSTLCGKVPYSFSTAYQQYSNLRPALDTLELYTIATWYTDNNPSAAQEVQSLIQSCHSNSLPVIVVYGLPNKDCSAGYSNMGINKDTNDYINWLNNLVTITQQRQAVYILEPDALGLFAQGNACAQASGYIENIQIALDILSKTNSYIYLDIAHWALQSNDQQTRALNALVQMDPKKTLKGVSLNVSNYRSTSEMSFLCNVVHNLGLQTGRNLHCAIDTSRNNNVVTDGGDWCNNPEAGIGMPPMKVSDMNLPFIDFFLWVKIPGESDGYCHNGPTAGQFSMDLFSKLWNQSYFVKQLNAPTV